MSCAACSILRGSTVRPTNSLVRHETQPDVSKESEKLGAVTLRYIQMLWNTPIQPGPVPVSRFLDKKPVQYVL